MRVLDFTGFVACGLVLVAFHMKDMVPLRIAAICSNIAFLIYGIGLGLLPVALLHGILLPMNAWRLSSALAERDLAAPVSAQASRSSPAGPEAP